MLGALRRGARRFCLSAAAASLVLAFAGPLVGAAQTDTVPRPEVFRGVASAQAISVEADRDALLPVPELFRFIALDGSGQYEASTRQARASLLFPGNGLILGPSLACGTFAGQFPAQFKPLFDQCLKYKYPLTVYADDFAPDGTTVGGISLGTPGDTISASAARASAHAGDDATTTDAVMQDLNLLGVPPFGSVNPPIPGFTFDSTLLSVDSATSRTNQTIVKGVLVTESKVTLSGIRMLGGLLRIGSLRSESRVTDNANGKRTAVANLEISGVDVPGAKAQLTDQGFSTASQQKQLNDLLKPFNAKVTILGSEKTTSKNGAAVASVGGILIEFGRDVQGLRTIPGPAGDLDPNGFYRGTIQLGSTAARGSAATFGLDTTLDSLPVGGVGDFDLGGPTFEVSTAFDVSDESVAPDEFDMPLPRRALAPVPGGGVTPPRLARSLGGDVFGDRIGLVYLALVLAVLGLCIAPRLTVPARFPGPR